MVDMDLDALEAFIDRIVNKRLMTIDGTAVVLAANDDGTVTLDLGGGAIAPSQPALGSYQPRAAGDHVLVRVRGGELVVQGVVSAPAAPRVVASPTVSDAVAPPAGQGWREVVTGRIWTRWDEPFIWTRPITALPPPTGGTVSGVGTLATYTGTELIEVGYAQQGAAVPPVLSGVGNSGPQDMYITWSGHQWYVDNSVRTVGTSPQTFGRMLDCAEVMPDGRLKLGIRNIGGVWYSAEVAQNDASLGYGRYRFVWEFDGGVESEPLSVVLGMFTYDQTATPGHRERDAEVTQWNDAGNTKHQMWYSLQPVAAAEQHQTNHVVSGAIQPFTTDIVWQAGQVHYSTSDANGMLLGDHVVTDGVETPNTEKVGINLWLTSGAPPANGQPVTAYLHSFTHTPGTTYTPTKAATRFDTFDNDYGWSVNKGSAISGGTLRLPCIAGYSNAYSGSVFDIRESTFDFDIVAVPAGGNGTTEALVSLRFDADNYLMFLVSGGGYAARVRQGGVNTQVSIGAFSYALHRYGRIAMSGGQVTFSTSADRVTWTAQGAAVTCTISAARLSALRFRVECGYYGTENNPGPFVVHGYGTPTGAIIPTSPNALVSGLVTFGTGAWAGLAGKVVLGAKLILHRSADASVGPLGPTAVTLWRAVAATTPTSPPPRETVNSRSYMLACNQSVTVALDPAWVQGFADGTFNAIAVFSTDPAAIVRLDSTVLVVNY